MNISSLTLSENHYDSQKVRGHGQGGKRPQRSECDICATVSLKAFADSSALISMHIIDK